MGDADHRTAYEGLLREHLPALRRLARSYCRDIVEQDDLLQEIALGLWTALPHFRGEASERTWLYRVAHNIAISFVTRRKRRSQREQSGETPEVPAPSGSPESTLIEDQQRARLWEAVNALPLSDDKQIRLLGSYRFRYLMPLSIPFFWGIFELAMDDASTLSGNLLVFVAPFAAAAWLNENWGIRRLEEERAQIERLYEE